jgi:hypothetical protein
MRLRDIKVDKCYRTPANQVRYVLRITGDEVRYASRGQHRPNLEWWKKNGWRKTSIESFARDVVAQVARYWDPDYSSLKAKSVPAQRRSSARPPKAPKRRKAARAK